MKKALTILLTGGTALASAQQINYTFNGGNGSGGLGEYGIVTQANAGQALLGAEGNGDIYGNLNLGTNISGTRRFWHISKRTSSESHALHFYYYNGSTFQGPNLTLATSGNVGIGTYSPLAKLEVNGSILQNAENTAFGVDNIGDARLGFIKKTGSIPVLASNSGGPIIFSQTNQSGIYTNIAGSTLTERMRIDANGNVGIGSPSPDQKLTVKGIIHAQEVRVDLTVPGPDYVFEKSYRLLPLEEIKSYIDQNKHLPEVPSAAEMEKNGVQLGEMNMLLLKKVEELTLYVIELKTENREMKSRIAEIEKSK
jgi:hypothetical protein